MNNVHPQVPCRRPSWILLVISLLCAASLRAQDENSSQNTPADNPPSRVARIAYLKGRVDFLRAGLDQWSEAALNFPATTGDRIYTDKGAKAELQIGPYTVRMWERTDLTITNLNDEIMQLGLEQGSIRVNVREVSTGETVEVDTPNGALTLLDRGKYRVDVNPDGNQTVVSVFSGRLQVTGGGASQTVDASQAVKLTGQDLVQVESIPMPPPDDFDVWSEERDLHLKSSKSGQYVNPVTPGFEDLDDYGYWSEVVDYGPVWFPPVAAGWVPYRFGNWAWIDPWGWTWVEAEPWGFCPFHYGRWVFIGAAWGWLPGPFVMTPVYAPAFVAFLGGTGFSIGVGAGLVGWFPLGPREPFFPWYHYSGNYLNVVNVTNIRNVTNITNITNVTNINNVHYAYKNIATTAVPKQVFSSGQPVAKHVARVSPQQLANAQVIPHPAVNPTKQAAMPGKPVAQPPVHPRPLATARTTAPNRNAAASTRQPSGLITRNTPPEENTKRVPPPPSRMPPASPRQFGPPNLITRAAPPLARVPFTRRLRAMAEHPGRPLEPAQVEALREGRPAMPMRDREFPPHLFPIVPMRPAMPAARPARP